ncbi:MAG TPA: retropepsin-like aspartic protease [Thermoanaerobaculia bacterium]|nr:retropepsin-like aspartic protease [Thermoanaerobaculia bacterium]
MLERDGQPFAKGEARFLDQIPGSPEPNSKIFVRFRLGDQTREYTALLDTGATYSVLRTDVAERAGIPPGDHETVRMSTRLGTFEGRLVRWTMTLAADRGEELRTEAMFLLLDRWPGGNILGYSGFLEWIRFALDPPANRFYFGSLEGES